MKTKEQTIQGILDLAMKGAASVTTTQRYSLEIDKAMVADLLRKRYSALVARRGATAIFDETVDKRLSMVARWLTDGTLRPSLLLYGGVGNGKTTTALAIADTITAVRDAAKKYTAKENLDFWDKTDEKCLAEHLQYCWPAPTKMSAQNLVKLSACDYEKVRKAPFLVLDDLGCEPAIIKTYGTETTPLVEVISCRYDMMAPTVITTNLDLEEITSRYGLRVGDRMHEVFERISFTNKSYRQ